MQPPRPVHLLVLLVLIASACARDPALTAEATAGAPVPELRAHRFEDGAEVRVDPAGRVLVINLWASWCPPCRREMPGLSALSDDIPELLVLGLSVDDDVYLAEEFLRGQALSFANFHDRDRRIANQLVSRHVYPQTFVFDGDGKLAWHVQGEVDWGAEAVRRALRELVAGNEASTRRPWTGVVQPGGQGT